MSHACAGDFLYMCRDGENLFGGTSACTAVLQGFQDLKACGTSGNAEEAERKKLKSLLGEK